MVVMLWYALELTLKKRYKTLLLFLSCYSQYSSFSNSDFFFFLLQLEGNDPSLCSVVILQQQTKR